MQHSVLVIGAALLSVDQTNAPSTDLNTHTSETRLSTCGYDDLSSNHIAVLTEQVVGIFIEVEVVQFQILLHDIDVAPRGHWRLEQGRKWNLPQIVPQ